MAAMRRFLVLVLLPWLTACGGAGATSATQSPARSAGPAASSSVQPSQSVAGTPAASPSQLLFAVLETRRTGAQSFDPHDTIAIANAQGYAVAKKTFSPRSVPQLFDAATVMQPEAQVAAGGVYFADDSGQIRRLDPTGKVTPVASFPLTSSQQQLSFAVSPDGSQLMAARLTFPTLVGTPPPTPTGSWSLDILKAAAGGATSVVKHWQGSANDYPGSTSGFTTIYLVGWDGSGPIGLVGADFATQQGLFDAQRFYAGQLAYLDPSGNQVATIGGSDCSPFAPPTAGRVICASFSGQSTVVSVRTDDGHEIWHGTAPNSPSGLAGGFVLSPDGQRLAMDGEMVTLSTGATAALPSNFTPASWLGTTGLLGTVQGGEFVAVVHLSGGPSLENWGFSGQIVGVLR